MATKPKKVILNVFADVCKLLGKNEQDYAVLETASLKEKVDICMSRCKLIAKAYNGDRKVKIGDTTQKKWYPWYWINEDKDAPGGFRLSFHDSDCGHGFSVVGVRPYFLEQKDCDEAAVKFLGEFEALLQYEAMLLERSKKSKILFQVCR